MAKNTKDIGKLCRKCSLDCDVLRTRTMANVPEIHRQKAANSMFSNTKPLYSRSSCPKMGKKSTKQQESNLSNTGKETKKEPVKEPEKAPEKVEEPKKAEEKKEEPDDPYLPPQDIDDDDEPHMLLDDFGVVEDAD